MRRLIDQGAPATLAISDSSQLLPAVLPDVVDVLPADALEDNEERADSRTVNSWLLRLNEVSAREMLEVQLVNSVAPFLLNSRLKTLLMRSPFAGDSSSTCRPSRASSAATRPCSTRTPTWRRPP